MEQKIDLEIRLRELAAQSMLEAQNEIDVLEVEKSLLTSDQRMNCYAAILEQQRKQLSNPSLSTDSGRGSKSGAGNHHYHHHHHHHRPRSQLISASSQTNQSATITQQASDVIGAPANSSQQHEANSNSSPSFGSLSNSQSPSKLSPVSGESANSPSSMSASSRHSRTGHCRRSTSSSSTLNAKQKAKNKRREQLMQNITSLSNINCNMVLDNKASVSISEIRVPLMWRDVDHFKGRGDYKRYAVFCLLKIDSQIYDTQLISDVDREVTDVTFDDLVIFNDIGPNFELNLEVYSCVYYEQFSFTSTPRKLKEKLTSSVSRAMGRRLATQTASVNYTKELQAYDKSYRFALIASATMRLDDASDSVKTYDLVLMSPSAHHRTHLSTSIGSSMYNTNNSYSTNVHSSSNNNNYHHHNNNYLSATLSPTTTTASKDADKNTLPLFGHFCCKLFVKPDVFDKNIKTGYLRVATISIPASTNNNNNNHNNTSNGNLNSTSPADKSLNGTDSTSQAKLRSALVASGKMATLSMSSSTLHWGLLRNFVLYLWPVDEQKLQAALTRGGEVPQLENPRKPRFSLNIDKYARLLRVSNSSITLETDDGCYVLGAYSPENSSGLCMNQADEIGHWLRSIEQFIYDSHIWGTVLNHYPPQARQAAISASQLAGSGVSSSTTPRTKY